MGDSDYGSITPNLTQPVRRGVRGGRDELPLFVGGEGRGGFAATAERYVRRGKEAVDSIPSAYLFAVSLILLFTSIGLVGSLSAANTEISEMQRQLDFLESSPLLEDVENEDPDHPYRRKVSVAEKIAKQVQHMDDLTNQTASLQNQTMELQEEADRLRKEKAKLEQDLTKAAGRKAQCDDNINTLVTKIKEGLDTWMQQEKLTLQQLIDDNVAQIISPEDGEEGTTTPQATQQPVRLKATATPAPNMEELVAPPNETAAEDVSRSAGGTRRRQQ